MRIILEVPDPITPPPESVSTASDSEAPFKPRPDEEKFLRTAPIMQVEQYLKSKLGLAGTAASAPDASPAALAPEPEDDAPSPDFAAQPKTRTQEGSMRKKDPAPLTLGAGTRAKQAPRVAARGEQPTISEAPSPRVGNLLDRNNPNDIRDPQKDNPSVFQFQPPKEGA